MKSGDQSKDQWPKPPLVEARQAGAWHAKASALRSCSLCRASRGCTFSLTSITVSRRRPVEDHSYADIGLDRDGLFLAEMAVKQLHNGHRHQCLLARLRETSASWRGSWSTTNDSPMDLVLPSLPNGRICFMRAHNSKRRSVARMWTRQDHTPRELTQHTTASRPYAEFLAASSKTVSSRQGPSR